MSWYLNVLKNYVGFSGRARRKEYWMFTLFNLIILYGLMIAASVTDIEALSYLAIGYALAVLLPTIAVAVRRLHDTGKSGAWYLIAFVPIVGGVWLLSLLATAGVTGPNVYGPDPKQA